MRKAGREEGTDEEEKHRARQEAGVFIDIDIERIGLPFVLSYLLSAWPQLYSVGAAPEYGFITKWNARQLGFHGLIAAGRVHGGGQSFWRST